MIPPLAITPRAVMTARPKPERDDPIADLAPKLEEHGAGADVGGFTGDIVDEWGRQSFPASDPPANW